ncbi:hypothetical protein BD311DRAFT_456332 [Dichomitus squalens]|uniref:Uncharacterized protein n=1 Tax=Dichomitus squalens TaxID=114155 RepID=A0A4Q9MJH5_9APHY|nr:hypothetical protein BD311DRAFT_456332 [Dichomitus squalens]
MVVYRRNRRARTRVSLSGLARPGRAAQAINRRLSFCTLHTLPVLVLASPPNILGLGGLILPARAQAHSPSPPLPSSGVFDEPFRPATSHSPT